MLFQSVFNQCFFSAKSKFDDQSDNESETGSVHLNDHHDDDDYLQDTPPMSPIELKPELPPYFPALQVHTFAFLLFLTLNFKSELTLTLCMCSVIKV